mmetsp:Transcript_22749/g.61658  ORF Transcript_22749/g.61658 Transcript_22749/m.61658 type:complete len:185 (+) Transcript_22749:535-1089(+)
MRTHTSGIRILLLFAGPATPAAAMVGWACAYPRSTPLGAACQKVARKHYGDTLVEFHNNIHSLTLRDIKHLAGKRGFDQIICTSPCAPFSALGKRDGFNVDSVAMDSQKSLTIMRWALDINQRCICVLENVRMTPGQLLQASALVADVLPCMQALQAARTGPTRRFRYFFTNVAFAPARLPADP